MRAEIPSQGPAVRVRWYVDRLRGMSGAEVGHRLVELVNKSRYRARVGQRSAPPLVHAADAPGVTAPLIAYAVDESEAFFDLADRALSGTIDLLGAAWTCAEPAWDRDPVSGYGWPTSFGLSIDYRHLGGVDPKYAWEKNRLLFLVPILVAARLGHRPTDAEALVGRLLDSWLREARPGQGIAWSSGIEVGLRVLSLTAVAELLPEDAEDLRDRIGAAIADHVDFLFRFPSRHSSANNHRVAELVGLLAAASHWRPAPAADAVSALESELVEVADSLFAPDGIGLEQSPTYSAFTLELLAVTLRSHRWRSEAARAQLAEVTDRGFRALSAFVEDWRFVKFGDDDEGRVFGFGLDEPRYLEYLDRLADGRLQEDVLGLSVFRDGGYSLLREPATAESPRVVWTLDHGPLGFGAIAAHGHDDVLSVTLSVDSKPWLVDAGTGGYFGDPGLRNFFRSEDAHNSPVVPGVPRAKMTGPFNWAPRRPLGRLLKAERQDGRSVLAATHDGYRRKGLGWEPTRTLEQRSTCAYRVIDQVADGVGFRVSWLLHPGCRARAVGASRVHVTRDDSSAWIEISFDGADRIELVQPELREAIFSPSYGHVEPTTKLVVSTDGDPSSRIIADFSIRTDESVDMKETL